MVGRAAHCRTGGLLISLFLAYISSVSFCADHWYTGDKTDSDGVPDYKKQYVCNAIDLINVPLIGTLLSTLGLVQYLYAPAMGWVYPVLSCVFIGGVCVQQKSLTYAQKFTDIAYSEGYDKENPPEEAKSSLTTYLHLHTTWHILAVIPPLVQMYGLLTYGVNLPCLG